jgi:hypothetical protein
MIPLPLDHRAGQCKRAADYIAAHPGCSIPELGHGADLGSATKVISEMSRLGYRVCKLRETLPCVDGTRKRRGTVRLYLEGQPATAQLVLFPPK